MKIYKLFILVSVAFIVGCIGEDCSDTPEFTDREISGITINRVLDDSAVTNIFNSSLLVGFESEEPESLSINSLKKIFENVSISLFSKAYATTCIPLKFTETITYINITSDADYNENYLAGTSLNELFSVDFSEARIEESLYGVELNTSGFTINVRELPSIDLIHSFRVELMLDNGDSFAAVIQDIIFE